MTPDILDDLLPDLSVRDGGDIVDRKTGAYLDLDDKAAVKAACGAVLDAYAHAVHKAEALRFDIEAKRAPLVAAALQAVEAELADDLDYQAALAERTRVQAEGETILEGLNGALAGRTGDQAISLDTGSALVTWGKARETWSLAHPASWYVTDAASRSLTRVVAGIKGPFADDQQRFRITVNAVIDWLDPTAKLSDLPPVRVTLRGDR